MFSRLGELLGGRVVTLLALAVLAATLAHPAVAQAPARKVVESAGDLARFNYPISGTATTCNGDVGHHVFDNVAAPAGVHSSAGTEPADRHHGARKGLA